MPDMPAAETRRALVPDNVFMRCRPGCGRSRPRTPWRRRPFIEAVRRTGMPQRNPRIPSAPSCVTRRAAAAPPRTRRAALASEAMRRLSGACWPPRPARHRSNAAGSRARRRRHARQPPAGALRLCRRSRRAAAAGQPLPAGTGARGANDTFIVLAAARRRPSRRARACPRRFGGVAYGERRRPTCGGQRRAAWNFVRKAVRSPGAARPRPARAPSAGPDLRLRRIRRRGWWQLLPEPPTHALRRASARGWPRRHGVAGMLDAPRRRPSAVALPPQRLSLRSRALRHPVRPAARRPPSRTARRRRLRVQPVPRCLHERHRAPAEEARLHRQVRRVRPAQRRSRRSAPSTPTSSGKRLMPVVHVPTPTRSTRWPSPGR